MPKNVSRSYLEVGTGGWFLIFVYSFKNARTINSIFSPTTMRMISDNTYH